jgi:hypothetical protein
VRILHIARKPPQWLRVVLAGLLLAFAINSVADVAHRHDTLTAPAHICGYCATFGSLTDAPQHSVSIVTVTLVALVPDSVGADPIPPRHLSHTQPRGPPAFLKY